MVLPLSCGMGPRVPTTSMIYPPPQPIGTTMVKTEPIKYCYGTGPSKEECRDRVPILRFGEADTPSDMSLANFSCKLQAACVFCPQASFPLACTNPPLGWHVGNGTHHLIDITAALYCAFAPPFDWHFHRYRCQCHCLCPSHVDGVKPFPGVSLFVRASLLRRHQQTAFPLHGHACFSS